MTDYSVLKAELSKPVYSGMTDAQAATALKTTTVSGEVAVSGPDIGKLWARRGVLGVARERAARTTLTAAQRANAWTACEMVERDGFLGLDPTIPAQRAALVAMLDSFVTDAIMTAGDKTATLALLTRTQSVASSIGWAILHEMDDASAALTIATARAS